MLHGQFKSTTHTKVVSTPTVVEKKVKVYLRPQRFMNTNQMIYIFTSD